MHPSNQFMPTARVQGLIVTELADETLVYDEERDRAHCLNESAARVWKACNGARSAADIATHLQAEQNAPFTSEVVWLALQELDRSHLLQDHVVLPPELAGLSRRAFLKKAGAVALAAIILPRVTSISVPTPALGVSLGGPGAPCGSGLQCASGICIGGFCR